MRSRRALLVALGCAGLSALVACVDRVADIDAFPTWAFPTAVPSKTVAPVSDARLTVAGSRLSFTRAEISDFARAPDWTPERHPPAPRIVLQAEPGQYACGFCHMPDGSGRPENASLAGLPADYFRRQVEAFASGDRTGADPHWFPAAAMRTEARAVTPTDIDEAAAYFSGLRLKPQRRVLETDLAQQPAARGYLLMPGSGARVPLGLKILEGPDDFGAFEKRAPDLTYTAWVPTGSLARGRLLVASGAGDPALACGACHGDDLHGADGPPLAGRSPSYLFRQLYAFQTGGRRGGNADIMAGIAAKLSRRDMIAAAAYAGSLRP